MLITRVLLVSGASAFLSLSGFTQADAPLPHRIGISFSRSATPPISIYDQTGPERNIKLGWAKCDNLGLAYSYHFNDRHGSWLGASAETEVYLPRSQVDIAGYTTPYGIEGLGIHLRRNWDIEEIFHFNLLAGRTAKWSRVRTVEYYVGAGIVESTLTYALTGWYEYVDTTFINYGGADVDFADEHLVAPSVRFGGDVIWSWGRHGSFSLGALAVVTGRYISGGYVILPGTPRESTGKFRGTLSHVGIRIGYGFRWGTREKTSG